MWKEIDIKIFEILDEIADQYGVQAQKWAKAAGIPNSRISDCRNLAMGKRVKRAFTVVRAAELVQGLNQLIGEDNLAREILKRIEKLKDRKQRLLLHCLILKDEEEPQVEMYLKQVNKAKK